MPTGEARSRLTTPGEGRSRWQAPEGALTLNPNTINPNTHRAGSGAHHSKLLDDGEDVRGRVLARQEPRERPAALHRQQPHRVLVCMPWPHTCFRAPWRR